MNISGTIATVENFIPGIFVDIYMDVTDRYVTNIDRER